MQQRHFLTLALLGLITLSGCGTSADMPSTSGAAASAPSPTTAPAQELVFVRETGDWNTDLFVMDATGANVRQLTNTPHSEVAPVWSPDRNHIAFMYDAIRGPNMGFPPFQLYTIHANGSDRVQHTGTLTETSSIMFPAWSPDGTRIAFIAAPGDGIWTVDLAGSAPQRLTPEEPIRGYIGPGEAPYIAPDPVRRYAGPLAWSPDGSSFLIHDNGILQIQLDGTLIKRLTDNALDHDPAWSPDGTQVAFVRTSHAPSGSRSQICIMNADGSDIRQLTGTPGSDAAPTWSPDGTRIAFASAPEVSTPTAQSDIFVINVDGTGLTNLTKSPEFEAFPSW